MNNVIYFVCIIIFPFLSYGQNEHYIPIRGENNIVLLRVDSLSFDEKHLTSGYYVDSISGQGYTGLAVIFYGEKALDSLELVDGYLDGWKKTYRFDNEGQELGYLIYTNQIRKINISSPAGNSKLKRYSAFSRYYTSQAYYYNEIIYKPSGKILIKQKIITKSESNKKKIRLNSFEELDCFFSHHIPIYKYCKEAGFFE